MTRFNLFIVRQCGDDARGQRWQIVHQQSGAHTLAASATAATTWLVGQVEGASEPPSDNGKRPLATESRWTARAAVTLRREH